MMHGDIDNIRDDMMYSMCQYMMLGYPVGGFLEAVLSNNLVNAASLADSDNQQCLFEYAKFLYTVVPMEARGSIERINAWQEARRANPIEPSQFRFISDNSRHIANQVWEAHTNRDTRAETLHESHYCHPSHDGED